MDPNLFETSGGMMMKRILWIFLLLSLMLLCGCDRELKDYTLETQASTQTTTEATTQSPSASTTQSLSESTTQAKEYREYTTYPVEHPKGHIVGNLYYYANSPVIRYYDTDLRRSVSLCSQPNCTHNNDNCIAYLGGLGGTSYCVEGDMVYAVVNDAINGGKIQLIERNMITGENRTLWDLTPGENMIQENLCFSVCDDLVFLTFREYEMEWNDEGTTYWEKNTVLFSYEIDTRTGERQELLRYEIPTVRGLYFSGSAIVPDLCTENYLFVQEVEHNGAPPMSEEEYYKQNPTADAEVYDQYVWEAWRHFEEVSHYSVDRRTGEKKRLYGNSGDAHIQDASGKREKKQLFTDGNTVCIYDGYTGQVTAYFEQENIGYMGYLDGRVIYNVWEEGENGDDIYNFFWYHLQTGERQPFQVGINGMVFSVQEETTDYFYGYYNGGMRFISKQDFYNENYDAAF